MADQEHKPFDYHLEGLGAVIYELSIHGDSVDEQWQQFEQTYPKEAVALLTFANRKEEQSPGAKLNIIAGFMVYYCTLQRSEKAQKLMQELFPENEQYLTSETPVSQLPLPIEANSDPEAA